MRSYALAALITTTLTGLVVFACSVIQVNIAYALLGGAVVAVAILCLALANERGVDTPLIVKAFALSSTHMLYATLLTWLWVQVSQNMNSVEPAVVASIIGLCASAFITVLHSRYVSVKVLVLLFLLQTGTLFGMTAMQQFGLLGVVASLGLGPGLILLVFVRSPISTAQHKHITSP